MEGLQVIAGPRRSGKTTAAIGWLLDGERREIWPYWTRVMVVPTMQMLDSVRADHFREIEDFSHRVFALPEWEYRARHNPQPEVLYEEAQVYLPRDASVVTLSGAFTWLGIPK